MKTLPILAAAAAVSALCVTGASAQQMGDWRFGVGIANVNPKSDNGTLTPGAVTVDDNTQISFTAAYFFRDNLGIELLAATPFEHDISIAGLGGIGSTKHLPPTLSLVYYFPTAGTVTPFVGAGINYTTFFDEEASGAIAGQDLSIDDSFGFALQAGVEFALTDRSALRLDARYIDIEADVSLDGANIGTVEIDPVVLGVSYIMNF
ncbi:OmpW family protein [Thalassococcus sp. S3]|uniref:OmpW/AlkL family protein n=1 Tax=Thalassococcus sp. S3 TaxID=2017482 RepID=UPI0010246D95|nr:OmpW family outer membrane protein [Thalassococcus sp. S3]QBF31326.1 hypothetical protein CFI11_08855 [Thalassococcus sp. S3]